MQTGEARNAQLLRYEPPLSPASAEAGGRVFQRLNRAEYESSICTLLDLDINAGNYLPLDTKSTNFDNITDE